MNLRNLAVLVSLAFIACNTAGLASEKRWEKAMQAETEAFQQGKFTQAEKYLKKAARAATKFDLDDPRPERTLNAAGDLFRAKGQYQHAERAYIQALVMGEAWLKRNNPVVAESLDGLGIVSQVTHQLHSKRAESFFSQALAIQEKVFGPDSLEVAFTLNCLGELNLSLGQDSVAEAFFQRSLEIREKMLGSNAPALATTLEDLALVYTSQGKFNQAESLFATALRIYKDALGPNHSEVALALRTYASLLAKMGRQAEAERLQAESFQIAAEQLRK